jgi:hypothetical protein
MTVPPAGDFEQLETVRLSAEGAAEMDRHRRLIFVPRADIIRLELAYGPGAEQPIVVALLGVFCAALAVGSVVTLILHILRGTVKLPAALITGVAFLIPAWWLLGLAFKKRWYLRVHTRTGTRKLVFHETTDARQIEAFVERARQRFALYDHATTPPK